MNRALSLATSAALLGCAPTAPNVSVTRVAGKKGRHWGTTIRADHSSGRVEQLKPSGWSTVCEGSCDGTLAPGRYRITVPGAKPVVVALDGESPLAIDLKSKNQTLEIAGGVTMLAGAVAMVAGLAMSVDSACLVNCTEADRRASDKADRVGLAGLGVLAVGGLMLFMSKGRVDIKSRTTGGTPVRGGLRF